jgi:hypothetical protein
VAEVHQGQLVWVPLRLPEGLTGGTGAGTCPALAVQCPILPPFHQDPPVAHGANGKGTLLLERPKDGPYQALLPV